MKTQHKKRSRRKASSTVNGIVPPRLTLNRDRRPREYLTPKEVERLMEGARRRGRYGLRDAMILVAYRHGLRPGELCALRWDQIDFAHGLLHAQRLKNGIDSVHPLGGTELRALKREDRSTHYVFMFERGAPLTMAGFRKLVARIGLVTRMSLPVHPHMLRHACGFKLANDRQDTRALQHYLGHKNIQHTVRYTELSPARFKNFWD
jgi:type 1 fimbriae regulatory protein FimB/type 1 fimbriae regulatory protein FimE